MQEKQESNRILSYPRVIVGVALCVFIVFSILCLASPVREKGKRSSDLQIDTISDDKTTVSRYVDSSGKITFALDKHYAIVETVRDGFEVTIKYYDEKGTPVKQPGGHYALLREYNDNGQLIQTTYLDNDGNPCENSGGYTFARYTYEKDKEYVKYYSFNAIRATAPYEGAGRCNHLDAQGNIDEVVFLNPNDKPAKIQSGYAIIKRIYYNTGLNAGKVEFEFYYDANEQPIALSHGEYGVHKEYDEFGRVKRITYLDSEANPIVTEEGYTIIERTYYIDDTIKTEFYFDLLGKPIVLSKGQSGVLNENDVVWLIKENGSKVFSLTNHLYTHPLIIITISILIVLISSICGKSVNVFLMVICFVIILIMTIVSRDGHAVGLKTDLFWSYKHFFSSRFIRIEILLNIWAFVPIGAILYKLNHRALSLFIPIAIACFIEGAQYFLRLGLAEVDDIFSNGFGGLVGYGLEYGFNRIMGHLSGFLSHKKRPGILRHSSVSSNFNKR